MSPFLGLLRGSLLGAVALLPVEAQVQGSMPVPPAVPPNAPRGAPPPGGMPTGPLQRHSRVPGSQFGASVWGTTPVGGTSSFYNTNGVDWAAGMCASRERQSPINLDARIIQNPAQGILEYGYEPVNNTQFIMKALDGLVYVDIDTPMGGITFNGEAFPLVRIDFHAQSEHTVLGKRTPLEVHLVHRKLTDPLRTLVVAIMVWAEVMPVPPPLGSPMTAAGPYQPPSPYDLDYNLQLQHFLTVAPPDVEGGTSDIIIPYQTPLDLNLLVDNPFVPQSSMYIQYTGSLTTPPCYDRTTWFVQRYPSRASVAQVEAMASAIFRLNGNRGNFRVVMPLNQRILQVVKARYTKLGAALQDRLVSLGPHARTDGEYMAWKLAKEVKEKSEQSMDYMKDFLRRLKNGTTAFGDQLNLSPSPATPNEDNDWQRLVFKTRYAMSKAIVQNHIAIAEAIRPQTLETHRKAADEAKIATQMVANTTYWITNVSGLRQLAARRESQRTPTNDAGMGGGADRVPGQGYGSPTGLALAAMEGLKAAPRAARDAEPPRPALLRGRAP